jgi:hypothetical protein
MRLTPNAVRLSFDKHRKSTKLGSNEHGNLTIHTVRHFFYTFYLVNVQAGKIIMRAEIL